MTAEARVPRIGILPFILIAGGVGTYFFAIAALASFPGVALGVSFIVLGSIIYICRGMAVKDAPYRASRSLAPDGDGNSSVPSHETDGPADDSFVLPEFSDACELKPARARAAI